MERFAFRRVPATDLIFQLHPLDAYVNDRLDTAQQEVHVTLDGPVMATIPPDIARYVAGAPEEADQFDFLIGEWTVSGCRYDIGAVHRYQARWRAESLHGGRIVLDDFTVVSPSGQELSSFVTLRTYAPAMGRWEIAGLAALQPGIDGRWNGHVVGAEMHLAAEIRSADGRILHNRIRFHGIEKDRFFWESHNSHDDRATWRLAASLIANRVCPSTRQGRWAGSREGFP
jgi:hypothetical protein